MSKDEEELVTRLRDEDEEEWPRGDPLYMDLRRQAADCIQKLSEIVRLQRLAIEALNSKP